MNLIQSINPKTKFRRLGLVDSLVIFSWAAMAVVVTGGCDTPAANSWDAKFSTATPTIQMVDAIEVVMTNDAYQATSFMGSLKPRRNIPLAFTQGGRVAKIGVVSGQQVTSGQILAQADTSELDARKANVETQLETARQRLNANQNSADQRTQVSGLQRELNEINQKISRATIKAPFPGVVTKRAIEEGQVVSAGMPIFDLVDSENLIVEVDVATRIANGMNRGDSVWVLIQGQPFAASIATVLPTTQSSTRTRAVTLNLSDDQASQILNPGDAVEVSYWTQTGESGFWLPYSVLQQQSTGLWSAMIVENRDNGAYAAARTLDVIQLHDDLALVQGALNQGDRVIINGLNRIVLGQKIQATLIENTMVIPSPEGAVPAAGGSAGSVTSSGTSP